MKKFLAPVLVALAVLLMSSCSSTNVTTAVTTGQTTSASTAEPTTETAAVETVESRLFKEEILPDSTKSTTGAKTTTETTKKQTTTTTVKDKRLETGNGKRLDFLKGVTVCGAAIEINGKTFTNCIIKDAPMNGVVISGVIWPWESEIKGLKLISNDEILASVPDPTTISTTTTPTTVPTTTPTTTVTSTPTTTPTTTIALIRTPTGVGLSKTFQAGDTVVGWKIVINGKTFEGGVVIYNSPLGGTVTDGVINPWSTEITNQTVISSSQILS